MKYVVCFSGGHSSALAAVETVIRHGRKNTILLNHDISSKVEDEDIKRFKKEVADYLEVPLVYANRDNFQTDTPLSLCRQMKMLRFGAGNSICTYYLKTEPFHKWLLRNFPVKHGRMSNSVTLVYGFDASEQHRIIRRRKILLRQGYLSEYPLADGRGDVRISDIRELGIALPQTYDTAKHANCKGCLKAGKQHWYMVYCLWPDIFWEAVYTEELLGYSIIKGYFLKELEPLFSAMKNENIRPKYNECSAFFLARVRQALKL